MKRTIFLILTSGLAGCAVGPRYVRPDVPVPHALVTANAAAMPLSSVTHDPVDLTTWWGQFGDPVLNDLIRRARSGNLDRQAAASRVREAQATADQARAALSPTVQANGGYYRARLSENVIPSSSSSGGSDGSGGGQSGGASGSSNSGAIQTDIFLLGLQGSYAPDLFGANSAAARAARERVEAQVWSAHDTEVTVASEVARAYFALRAAQQRRSILLENAGTQGELLKILVARARGGLVNEIDTARQRSQLSLIQAQIAPAEAEAAAYVHQLELLLGLNPGELDATLRPAPNAVALPALPPRVPIGLPSSILERRPDIRQAERTLAASVSDVDQATARLYPQIQLTGLASLVSSSLSSLIEWGSRSLLGGGTIAQTLFDGGSKRAQQRETQERSIQAGIAYRRAVLSAFSQTADALAQYGATQRQVIVLQAGYADARRAAMLNRAQYAGGLTDLTGTLQTQSTALQTQEQLVQAQGQALADLVALYRALGGGWDPEETAGARPVDPQDAARDGLR